MLQAPAGAARPFAAGRSPTTSHHMPPAGTELFPARTAPPRPDCSSNGVGGGFACAARCRRCDLVPGADGVAAPGQTAV